MTKKGFLIFLSRAFGIIVVCFIGLVLFQSIKMSAKKPKQKTKVIPKVFAKTVLYKPAKNSFFIEGYGYTKAEQEVDLNTQVSSKVIWKNPIIDEGNFVKKDTLLLKLDTQDFILQKNQNKQKEKTLLQQINLAENEILNTQKLLKLDEKQLALSKMQLLRYQKLKEQNAGNVINVEQAQAKVISNEELVLRRKNSLSTTAINIDVLKSQIAELQQANELLDVNILRCKIYAPIDGIITKDMVEEGQFVISSKSLVMIKNDDKYNLMINVAGPEGMKFLLSEDNFYQNFNNKKVKVVWSEDETVIFDAFLQKVIAYSAKMRSLKLKVALNKQKLLTDNMYCKVVLQSKEIDNCFKISNNAIVDNNQIYYIKDGKLAQAEVEILFKDSTKSIIRSSLKENTQIIITKVTDPLGTSVELYNE